jgi:hypothetical protein
VKLYKQEDGYVPCLYGEWQLTQWKDAVVCLVESEKTAVIASLYMPTFQGRKAIWLACGGVNGLTDYKVKVLKNRDVIMVADWMFSSRAVWGSVPMRKLKVPNPKGTGTITKVHKDGELDEDFVATDQRILLAGARSVNHFDPMPEVESGADIADLLVRMPMILPIDYMLPDDDTADDAGKVTPEDTGSYMADVTLGSSPSIENDTPFGW